jgi:hypothetical protein
MDSLEQKSDFSSFAISNLEIWGPYCSEEALEIIQSNSCYAEWDGASMHFSFSL